MYHLRTGLLFIVCCIALLRVSGQTTALTGRVTDGETNEALLRATIQLYRLGRDTTFVGGTLSDAQGAFTLNTNRTAGQYLLRISYLGYKTVEQPVTLTAGHTQRLGTIALAPDATQLEEAVVTANVPKMVIKDDTVVYNADAYRVPEGSVIESLVEALPGAKIDDDGKVRPRLHDGQQRCGDEEPSLVRGGAGEGLRREERPEPPDGYRRRQRRLRAGVCHQT